MAKGKEIRLKRLFNKESKNLIVVPMDHGVSLGPIDGLVDMPEIIGKVAKGGADAVLLHKGIVKNCFSGETGLIVHISASTKADPDPNYKALVSSVEEAIRLGADGVSVHINIGAKNGPEMIKQLGYVADACDRWGMPLLAMMYPRGDKIDNEHNPEWIKLAVRVGAELGADIIKTNYTGDIDSFREVVFGCPVPIVIAGGPKMGSDREVLEMVSSAMRAGARGVSIGRNVFQHKNPEKMVRALAAIVHQGESADKALELL